MEAWLSPMLCDERQDIPQGDDWVIERKLDGWRAIIHRTATDVRLYGGRNGSDYSGKVPYLEGVVSRLPHDTAVDGELVSPVGFSSVQSVMRRNGEHEPSTSSPPLKLVLFDILRVQGTDVRSLPWSERRAMLEACEFNGPLVFTSEVFDADERIHEGFLAEGEEGSVAKKVTGKYRSGSRSPDQVKIKPQSTLDAKVTGFKPGTPGSEFDGTLGALEFEVIDDVGKGAKSRCSGFDRKLRDEIWNDQTEWIGAIIEVKHHGLSQTGVPRHPQFLRRRDDRSPAPAPAKKKAPPRASNGERRNRNYVAMGDTKLVRTLHELQVCSGEGYERAENKHRGRDEELAVCIGIAKSRGLA